MPVNCLKHGFDWPPDKTCPYCDVERLEKLVYLPGHWKCQKCDFYLVSTNLHAASGNFSANDKPHDCANGCGPMWRVTHEQSANDMVDKVERLTNVLGDFEDLHLCDCCEGLFSTINGGDHNQCDTCTELANMTAELESLKQKQQEKE